MECADNVSAVLREALDLYARAGPVLEGLERLERKVDGLSARLAAMEAGGFVPAAPPGTATEPVDAARKAAAALAAWCDS